MPQKWIITFDSEGNFRSLGETESTAIDYIKGIAAVAGLVKPSAPGGIFKIFYTGNQTPSVINIDRLITESQVISDKERAYYLDYIKGRVKLFDTFQVVIDDTNRKPFYEYLTTLNGGDSIAVPVPYFYYLDP